MAILAMPELCHGHLGHARARAGTLVPCTGKMPVALPGEPTFAASPESCFLAPLAVPPTLPLIIGRLAGEGERNFRWY